MTAPWRNPGRQAGALFLLYFVLAFGGGILASGLFVPRDPAATVANLAAHEVAYRLAFAATMLSTVAYVALTIVFYRLFAHVNKTLALFAVAIGLCGCGVQAVAAALQLAPFLALPGSAFAAAFGSAGAQVLAASAIALYSQAYAVSLVLFAFYDLSIGYLIVRSTFLPRAVGGLLIVAGAAWLAFLWPPLASAGARVILPVGALAELVLMFWLLVKGVDETRLGLATAGRD